MKKFVSKYLVFVIIILMFALLIPGIANRISCESKNNNVIMSVLYNDIAMKVSKEKLESSLDEYMKLGIDTVSVMEEDLNAMVSKGEVTCIKYNVLCHKYDDESIRMADFIADRMPDINYDSWLLIASRDKTKEKLAYMLPRKFSDSDYTDIGIFEDLDIYVLHDGKKQLWDFAFGYDEEILQYLSNKGFNIALIHKVKNYAELEYLNDIDRLVKKYNIKHLNLKEDSVVYKESEIIKENYEGLARIINENDMTLVVAENVSQLSNQKFMGYSYIFEEVMKDGGSQKVLRSFETYDDSHIDDTFYQYRVEHFFNSTIDRNVRFITVTQIAPTTLSYDECADYTFMGAAKYKEKVESLGFTVNEEVTPLNYTSDLRFNSAVCSVIMVMCALLIIEVIMGKTSFALTILAFVFSVLAFTGTFIIPEALVLLYPTVFCVVQSCMAMTAVLYFIKAKNDKLPLLALILSSVGILLFVLLVCAIGMGAMLSGIEYYINNQIFRGIKISLIVPLVYTAVLYYVMFINNTFNGIISDIKKVLAANIKVYWVIIAGGIMAIGMYYIIRSGNVNTISSLEHALRTAVTEIFSARPRTKEFLIGYPALILFVYYMKRSDIQLIKWLLAVGAAILSASITNSFCHVFTDFTTIVSRTINGLIIGAFVSVVAFIANIVLIKVFKALKKRFID